MDEERDGKSWARRKKKAHRTANQARAETASCGTRNWSSRGCSRCFDLFARSSADTWLLFLSRAWRPSGPSNNYARSRSLNWLIVRRGLMPWPLPGREGKKKESCCCLVGGGDSIGLLMTGRAMLVSRVSRDSFRRASRQLVPPSRCWRQISQFITATHSFVSRVIMDEFFLIRYLPTYRIVLHSDSSL